MTEKLSVDVDGAVNSALSSGDSASVIRSIQSYMVLAMKVLLMECKELGTDGGPIKEKLRFLIKEELVLDPFVKKIDFGSASQLKKLIQRMVPLAGTEPAKFETMASEFEATLSQVFPFAD